MLERVRTCVYVLIRKLNQSYKLQRACIGNIIKIYCCAKKIKPKTETDEPSLDFDWSTHGVVCSKILYYIVLWYNSIMVYGIMVYSITEKNSKFSSIQSPNQSKSVFCGFTCVKPVSTKYNLVAFDTACCALEAHLSFNSNTAHLS